MEKIEGDLTVNGNLDLQKNLQVNANGFYFGKLEVSGMIKGKEVEIENTLFSKDGKIGIGTKNPAQKLHIQGDLQVEKGWIRVKGSKGIYFQDYKGGFHMTDSNWIKAYGGKALQVSNLVHSTKGGFKFPDGSVQAKASRVTTIRTGIVNMNVTGSWKTSPLSIGKRYTSPFISITGFKQTPIIFPSILHVDSSKAANLRIDIKIVSASSTRFRIEFNTWADSKIYNCRVQWVALGN